MPGGSKDSKMVFSRVRCGFYEVSARLSRFFGVQLFAVLGVWGSRC